MLFLLLWFPVVPYMFFKNVPLLNPNGCCRISLFIPSQLTSSRRTYFIVLKHGKKMLSSYLALHTVDSFKKNKFMRKGLYYQYPLQEGTCDKHWGAGAWPPLVLMTVL